MPAPPQEPTTGQGRADRWAQRLWALYEVGQAISSSMDPEELMGLVVDKACSLMEVERCGLFLVESRTEEGISLRRCRARGLPEEYFRHVRLGHRESIAGQVIANGQTLRTDDILTDPRFVLTGETRALMVANNIRGVLSAPVMAPGGPLGVLSVYREAGVGFTPEEEDLLAAFAFQVGIALENARLLAESKRSLRRAQALLEVSKALASSLDTESTLDLILRETCELMGVRHCILWSREGGAPEADRLRARARCGFDPAALERLLVRSGVGIAGRVLRERTPAWTSDLAVDVGVALPPRLAAALREQGLGAVLGVPVETGESFVGVLSVYRPPGGTFSEDEVTLLWSLADMAAIALENVRLVAADREKGQLEAILALARTAADRILNPLTVISGHAQLLAGELPANHPGQPRIGRILENARRIERIVKQMNRITRYRTREFSPGLLELELEKAAEAEPPEPGASPPAGG